MLTEEAIGLIVRSSEGILRYAKNLCLSALIEAVRDQTKTVDLPQVNRVLIQPHWRHQRDQERHRVETAAALRPSAATTR